MVYQKCNAKIKWITCIQHSTQLGHFRKSCVHACFDNYNYRRKITNTSVAVGKALLVDTCLIFWWEWPWLLNMRLIISEFSSIDGIALYPFHIAVGMYFYWFAFSISSSPSSKRSINNKRSEFDLHPFKKNTRTFPFSATPASIFRKTFLALLTLVQTRNNQKPISLTSLLNVLQLFISSPSTIPTWNGRRVKGNFSGYTKGTFIRDIGCSLP